MTTFRQLNIDQFQESSQYLPRGQQCQIMPVWRSKAEDPEHPRVLDGELNQTASPLTGVCFNARE
jgi:hypothetical protein